MTKLTEWLSTGGFIIAVWAVLLTKPSVKELGDPWYKIVLFLPIILVILFGVFSLFMVILKTYKFNDCPAASEELKKEIQMAREDLKKKGFEF